MFQFICGVPQGFILGPLFFIIYVNGLAKLYQGTDVRITLYADDTVLYTANASPNRAAQSLETGLVSWSKWCIQNRLTINAKKQNKPKSGANNNVVNVNLNGASLDVVHSYNYLGVIIDDHLTFSGFLKSIMTR